MTSADIVRSIATEQETPVGESQLFSPARYAGTRAPIEEAEPLPPDVYFSQEWYDREVETIFRKCWLLATREEWEIHSGGLGASGPELWGAVDSYRK